jgi:molecular chaperone DnaK (HSP70)
VRKVLGIDLGTYNSEAAIVTIPDEATEATIEMVGKTNTGAHDVPGSSLERVKSFPSFVSYNPDGSLNSVGLEAKLRISSDPKHVIWGMKRLLGKTYSEASSQNELNRFIYDIEPDSETGQCLIKVGEKKLRPEEVCAELLKKIKREAETIAAIRFHDVVISVPAYFDAVPVTSIITAAKLAGFKNVRTIPEPVAAAIVYRIPVNPRPKNVLVFDLGAGTLDVTAGALIRKGPNISDIIFIIKTTTGNTHLGGLDMDDRMEKVFLKKLGIKDKKSLSEEQQSILRQKAEEAKILLSASKMVEIDVFTGINKRISIDEDEFKTALMGSSPQESDLLEECEKQVYQALENAGWSPKDVDLIFLIGGPSSLPLVQERLSQIFINNIVVSEQLKQIRSGIFQVDLMEAVAQGAALSQETKSLLTHPYGYGFVNLRWTKDDMIQEPEILIPRNAIYPTKQSAAFINWFSRDITTKVEIIQQIPVGSDTDEYRTLGEVEIALQNPGILPVEVGMQLNENEELVITLHDTFSGYIVEYAGIGHLRRAKRVLPRHTPLPPPGWGDRHPERQMNEKELPNLVKWAAMVCRSCKVEMENKKIKDSKLETYHANLNNTLRHDLVEKGEVNVEKIKQYWQPLLHHSAQVIHRAREMNVFDSTTVQEIERNRDQIMSRIWTLT